MSVHHPSLVLILAATLLSACSSGGSGQVRGGRAATKAEASAHDQVVATERAFAKSMADRDFKSFQGFLSGEAIFFTGSAVEHGPKAIAATWKPYFNGKAAPFSWAPDNVQVLDSGKLALSTGPIYVDGKEVARFNSIWRLEGKNSWRIVFDKGEAVCGAAP
jgi:ketosteroid isomerase-like protein